jgi:hypothetical protein
VGGAKTVGVRLLRRADPNRPLFHVHSMVRFRNITIESHQDRNKNEIGERLTNSKLNVLKYILANK